MRVRNSDSYEFCEQWYQSSVYRMMYSEVLHATRDSKQWDHTSDERVLPPRATKQPGQPKKNRLRTEDRGRQRRVVTCGNCKERGHNDNVVAIHRRKPEDAAVQIFHVFFFFLECDRRYISECGLLLGWC